MCYLRSYDFAYKASGNKIDYLRGETVYTIRKPEAKWIVKNKLSAATWCDDRRCSKDEDNFALESSFFRVSSRFFAAHRIGKSTNFLIRRDAIRLWRKSSVKHVDFRNNVWGNYTKKNDGLFDINAREREIEDDSPNTIGRIYGFEFLKKFSNQILQIFIA